MNNTIFVWTLSDVVGLILMMLIVIVFIAIQIVSWWKRRKRFNRFFKHKRVDM